MVTVAKAGVLCTPKLSVTTRENVTVPEVSGTVTETLDVGAEVVIVGFEGESGVESITGFGFGVGVGSVVGIGVGTGVTGGVTGSTGEAIGLTGGVTGPTTGVIGLIGGFTGSITGVTGPPTGLIGPIAGVTVLFCFFPLLSFDLAIYLLRTWLRSQLFG
jgi:hypothetical protein